MMTEAEAIETLETLAKEWPKSLWLFAGTSEILVMRCKEDGSRAYNAGGGVDSGYIVTSVSIPSDGGDF